MSDEETGGMSSIKKTLIGIVTTAVTAAGVYVTTHIEQLFGIEGEEPTEQVGVQNNNTQQQNQSVIINIPEQKSAPTSTNTIIRETIKEVPTQQPVVAPAVVIEKKETTAERIARLKADKAAREVDGQ
jgi:hypothetical protein